MSLLLEPPPRIHILRSAGAKYGLHSWDYYSLSPGRCGCNLKLVIFKLKSTLTEDRYIAHHLWNCPQVSATWSHWWLINISWCRQASQFWPRSMWSCEITRPQWVKWFPQKIHTMYHQWRRIDTYCKTYARKHPITHSCRNTDHKWKFILSWLNSYPH